jgi:hypothetical protein
LLKGLDWGTIIQSRMTLNILPQSAVNSCPVRPKKRNTAVKTTVPPMSEAASTKRLLVALGSRWRRINWRRVTPVAMAAST